MRARRIDAEPNNINRQRLCKGKVAACLTYFDEMKVSKVKNSHLFMVKVYGIIWVLIAIVFWLFYQNPQMSLLNIIIGQYVILPILTFILSVFIGKEHLSVKYIWLVPICFSIAYIVCRLLTQSLAQYILAGVAAFPGITDFLFIVILSVVGLLIGYIISKFKRIK